MDPEILACLPDKIHPVSQLFLDQWLDGRMATAEFMRWFHMPNSDYLSVTECILAAVTLIGT